jgi:hypothetical protein
MDAGSVQPGHPDLTVLNALRSWGLPLWGLTTTPNKCSATTRLRIRNGIRVHIPSLLGIVVACICIMRVAFEPHEIRVRRHSVWCV